MAKKMKSAEDFMHHLYIHMNDVDHFVIFSGVSLKQFLPSVESVKNVLLLKHAYEEGSFNMHTQFDFVSSEDMQDFLKTEQDLKKDLCWVDFTTEKNVNALTPLEQAELLYFSHKREPLATPFLGKLQNRYAYYSSVADKMTKVYFRFIGDSELLVANLFNQMIKEKENVGSFWRRKNKDNLPMIDPSTLRLFRPFVKEGALLSLYKLDKPSAHYGIEIRTLSDYDFPDEVWDDLDELLKLSYDELIQIS
ncbi:hypothetical protein [Solibacillus cecembensis]|uniref:hypothetical protein n=1 Tax=Solibacillus cecembensis TaxID=459347 RepID=UPI0007170038